MSYVGKISDEPDITKTYAYDSDGNMTSSLNEYKNISSTEYNTTYNSLGEVIETSTTDHSYNITIPGFKYTYDTLTLDGGSFYRKNICLDYDHNNNLDKKEIILYDSSHTIIQKLALNYFGKECSIVGETYDQYGNTVFRYEKTTLSEPDLDDFIIAESNCTMKAEYTYDSHSNWTKAVAWERKSGNLTRTRVQIRKFTYFK